MKFILQLIFSLLALCCMGMCFAVPVTGNINGNVTLVEYYDYECPHCRRMESVIDKLQAAHPDLKVVHRAVPVLTPGSYAIASFALAPREQNHKQEGRWKVVHQMLMQSPTAPTFSGVLHIAKIEGLNFRNISKAMQGNSIRRQLEKNIQLARRHSVNGKIYLPTLVFGRSDGKGQTITVYGEQPYALLSAILKSVGHRR